MKLSQVLAGVELRELHGDPNLEVRGVSYDSRTTQPGDLFVAVTGYAADGHRFIPMALEKGACAVLCEHASPVQWWNPPGRPWPGWAPTGTGIRRSI